MNAALEGQIVDRDALEIGELYGKARSSIVESVRYLIECGQRLAQKKEEVGHGNWLPWLEANYEVLGFNTRHTSARLIRIATNVSSTIHLEPGDALKLSREVWGNDTGALLVQSKANRWYTPSDYIEAARRVLGGIDLDPASDEKANATIKAAEIYTEDQNGLDQTWYGRVWLNPPYGRKAGAFVVQLADLYEDGAIEGAICLVNAHCTDTEWFQRLWSYSLCFTNHRIDFHAGEEQGDGGSTHGSVFAYLGKSRQKFVNEFARFGAIVERVKL